MTHRAWTRIGREGSLFPLIIYVSPKHSSRCIKQPNCAILHPCRQFLSPVVHFREQALGLLSYISMTWRAFARLLNHFGSCPKVVATVFARCPLWANIPQKPLPRLRARQWRKIDLSKPESTDWIVRSRSKPLQRRMRPSYQYRQVRHEMRSNLQSPHPKRNKALGRLNAIAIKGNPAIIVDLLYK